MTDVTHACDADTVCDYSKAAFLCEDRSNHFHANLMTDVTHACDADTV